MIKVIAKNVQQTIEIIEAFKDTTAELYIEIKNTTTRNSDVYDDAYGPKYHKASFMLNKIKRLLEQDY